MRNARLNEAETGIKIARRTINKLRQSDDASLMAESDEELKSLLMNVKEKSEKTGLLIFLLAILILACVSSSPAFLKMYSTYNLNKQGNNIQP